MTRPPLRLTSPGQLSAPATGQDSLQVLDEAIDQLARLRTPYWLGDSAVRLHALTSLITQAQQLLPQAVHDARDQELTWAQIGELLNISAATATGTNHDPLDKDHRHNADERMSTSRWRDYLYASILNHSNAVQIRFTNHYDALSATSSIAASRTEVMMKSQGIAALVCIVFSSGSALIASMHALREQAKSPPHLGRIGLISNSSLVTLGGGTRRRPCPAAPGPLEGNAARFDDLLGMLAQRRGFREYLAAAGPAGPEQDADRAGQRRACDRGPVSGGPASTDPEVKRELWWACLRVLGCHTCHHAWDATTIPSDPSGC
jgi:hypothetical protein